MQIRKLFPGLFGLLAIAFLLPTSAYAQFPLRTFVSQTGNDSTTTGCSRLNPCQSFNWTLARTADGGEITCLDSGTFSAVTITKAITIDCGGTVAGITHNTDVGILVNAGASDRVIIRNLSLHGFSFGNSGVQYNSGAELEIDNVTMMGGDPAFPSVYVNKSSSGILSIRNSNFSKRAVGIRMRTTSGNIVASVTNSNFNNLTNTGIEVGLNSYVGVHNSVFSAIYGYGINAATNSSTVYATDNVLTNNNVGISATVTGAKIIANANKIFGNSKAFNVVAGATFLSGNANVVDINPGNPPTGALSYR